MEGQGSGQGPGQGHSNYYNSSSTSFEYGLAAVTQPPPYQPHSPYLPKYSAINAAPLNPYYQAPPLAVYSNTSSNKACFNFSCHNNPMFPFNAKMAAAGHGHHGYPPSIYQAHPPMMMRTPSSFQQRSTPPPRPMSTQSYASGDTFNGNANSGNQVIIESGYVDCPFHNLRTEWYLPSALRGIGNDLFCLVLTVSSHLFEVHFCRLSLLEDIS